MTDSPNPSLPDSSDRTLPNRGPAMSNRPTLTLTRIDAEHFVPLPSTDRANYSGQFPTIPGYTLVSLLGTGGTGEVYEAVDGIGNRFALKRPRQKTLSASSLERFEREARAMSQLAHPNIARICYWGSHDGVPYFTMPIYSGGSMADRFFHYRNDLRATVETLILVADALAHIHSKRLLHRDLKPHNILLDADGNPAIADFGLVREIDGATATLSTSRLGTPAYMSPEQARGEHRVLTPQSDIWSFGVILYELLTGRRPFAGTEADTVIVRILTLPVPSPTSVVPDADLGLCRIVHNCLQKDPLGRYPSASQLREDLQKWLDGRSVPSRRVARQVRRYRLSAVTLVVALIGLLLLPGLTGRENTIAADPTMLIVDRGERAEVIGESGVPKLPLEIIRGLDFHETGTSVDGFAAFRANDTVQLRVATTPKAARWEFRADMRLSGQQLGCQSGIYFGRREARIPLDSILCGDFTWTDPHTAEQIRQARRDTELALSISSAPDEIVPIEALFRTKSKWAVSLKASSKAWKLGMSTRPLSNIDTSFDNAPQWNVHNKWRTLRMVVTPDRIRFYIDGLDVHSIPRPLKIRGERDLFEPIFGTDNFDLGIGEMGIEFAQCTVELKNVIVEPLPDIP